MSLELIITIIIGHWVGDYVLQTEKMAVGKATSIKWLSIHSVVWTLSMMIIVVPFSSSVTIWVWVLIMGILHWAQDFVTSKINAFFQKKKWTKMFWLSIGTDQMLHYLIMFGTLGYGGW